MSDLECFLFRFRMKDGKPVSFTWETDPGAPSPTEEFFLENRESGSRAPGESRPLAQKSFFEGPE